MDIKIASLILAAGRGSRMKGYNGSKTLLPLLPSHHSSAEGDHPILLEILGNLPPGPKAVVVNYRKEDIIRATRDLPLTYCLQPELNGTGGALLAASPFLKETDYDLLIVTMGDIPLVKKETYMDLILKLGENDMAILGFRPMHKKEYGILEMDGYRVKRIIEWKYWKEFSRERLTALSVCNSGIYAFKRDIILDYLPVLAERPHKVLKERRDGPVEVEEYFITDLVEYMHRDGLPVGFIIAQDEKEVMGIDDPHALSEARKIFMERQISGKANGPGMNPPPPQ